MLKIQSVKYPEMLLITPAGRVHFQAGQAEVSDKALEAEVRALAGSNDEDLGLIVPAATTGRKRRNRE
jgi:hypothetical protein|nr:MAG TPA: hypothetical protein [Caudoviricetes sp.]